MEILQQIHCYDRNDYRTCRSLVLEAFQQHRHWRVVCPANGQEQSCDLDKEHLLSAEAQASQLVWGEYERIDWERVYAGVTPLIPDQGRRLCGCLTNSQKKSHKHAPRSRSMQ